MFDNGSSELFDRDYLDFGRFLGGFAEGRVPPMGLSLVGSGSMVLATEEGRRRCHDFLVCRGVATGRSCFCSQTHSRTVYTVDAGWENGREGDGLVTASSHAVLLVSVADCMPILLFDPESGARGICHSGWRGTGIVREAVELMTGKLGCRLESLVVVLGPSIGECCYTVDPERWREFRNQWGSRAVSRSSHNRTLSLMGANLNILEELGVGRIFQVEYCTACNHQFGSFRREGTEYTRMVAYIAGTT